MDLHKQAPFDDAREVSLKLAKESAAHAETLAGLAGRAAEPWHKTGSGGFLRNVVYGFNDGLTANFGLVAGVIGADVAPHIVLVSGIAGMFADALSMGASGYLAAKSEQEVRSEEHTSELQSLTNLVCRLLLEKKKKKEEKTKKYKQEQTRNRTKMKH